MIREEKQLLLKNLCARLPYKVWIKRTYVDCPTFLHEDDLISWKLDEINIKPYLRPMSSMTKEEEYEYHNICVCPINKPWDVTDWLNKKGFDYMDLIPMGLALEAPEGMYKTE